MDKEKMMRDVFWIFRDVIHNGHIQIKVEDGKITSHSKVGNCDCYVCDIISRIEREIAELFGETYYTCKKVEFVNDNKSEKQIYCKNPQCFNHYLANKKIKVVNDNTNENHSQHSGVLSVPDEGQSNGRTISQSHADTNDLYECGHKGEPIILDSNELSIAAFFTWCESVGWKGDKSQCWECWCKRDANQNKWEKEGCGKEINPYKNIKFPCGDVAGGKPVFCDACEEKFVKQNKGGKNGSD